MFQYIIKYIKSMLKQSKDLIATQYNLTAIRKYFTRCINCMNSYKVGLADLSSFGNISV